MILLTGKDHHQIFLTLEYKLTLHWVFVHLTKKVDLLSSGYKRTLHNYRYYLQYQIVHYHFPDHL